MKRLGIFEEELNVTSFEIRKLEQGKEEVATKMEELQNKLREKVKEVDNV